MLGFSFTRSCVALKVAVLILVMSTACTSLERWVYIKEKKWNPSKSPQPVFTKADSLRGALRYERTSIDVHHYNLDITIDPKSQKIAGNVRIDFNVISPTKRIQIDLFENFHIRNISSENSTLAYIREGNVLWISYPDTLEIGANKSCTIEYDGRPMVAKNPPWKGGFVWRKDERSRPWVGVACERLGASVWWPNKDHLSDEPDSMTLTYRIPPELSIISNGNFDREWLEEGLKCVRWKVNEPIDNYNVSFYMGKYVNDSIPYKNTYIYTYALDYAKEDAKEFFAPSKDIYAFFEEVFGPYPFPKDKMGLVHSPYDGMEHQSCLAISRTLKKDASSYIGNSYIEYPMDATLLHEIAHEWWGNSISVADMADAWLQEGFASYAELLYLEHIRGKRTYRIEANYMSLATSNIFPVVGFPDVNDNTFVSEDIYSKGAGILHAFRGSLNNDPLFFKIIKGFYTKYQKSTVCTEDFISFVDEHTAVSYRPFFETFLYQADLPKLELKVEESGLWEVTVAYRYSNVKDGFVMPFCIRNGKKIAKLVGSSSWKTEVIQRENLTNTIFIATSIFENIWGSLFEIDDKSTGLEDL